MATSILKQQLISQIDKLNPEQLQQLLNYTMSLQATPPQVIKGEDLIKLAHEIDFPPDDLAEIVRAIEEDCERIDWDGWQ